MATIKNSRDVLLQAAADRLEDVELPGNVAVDFDNVIGATKPANNADVTQGAITSGVTVSGGGITLSGGGSIKGGQSGYDTGTGFFLGYTGGTYRFSLGNSGGNKVTWDGSTLSIVGDIVGSSNVVTNGQVRARGVYVGLQATAAVYANESDAADTAVFGRANSTDAAIRGYQAHTSDGAAVSGVAVGGIGVTGLTGSSTKAGIRGNNTGGGPSMECVTTFKWGSYTWATPGGSSTQALLANGTWGNPNAAYAGTAGETRNDALGASLWCGANQAILQTDGNFVVYNAGTPVGSSSGGFPSDERLKQDIVPTAVNALDVLGRLHVVDFRWRQGTPMHAQRGDQVDTGLIAQAVRDVLPGLVSAYGNADAETLLLNKTEIVPLLIKAVQELHAEVRELSHH